MCTDLCHMQIAMQYLPHCFFVNGHPLSYQSNTKPTIFSDNFFQFLGYCLWFLIWLGVVNVHHLQRQSGIHETFCAIQKRGFLTCVLSSKLPSKLEFYQKFQVNSLLSFRVKHFSLAATELLATMSNLQLLQAKVFSDAQKNVHLLSTSRYLICLKYNSNFVCNLSENCRLQLCAFLTSHSQKKMYLFMFLRQILSCYKLKTSFAKLVKVLTLELFYGTRTRVAYIFQYQYSYSYSYSKFFAVLVLGRSVLDSITACYSKLACFGFKQKTFRLARFQPLCIRTENLL